MDLVIWPRNRAHLNSTVAATMAVVSLDSMMDAADEN